MAHRMSWWIINLRMFWGWHSGKVRCVPWQILVVVFVFGLLPLCLSGLLFFLTKRKSGWGICGSSWLCVVGFVFESWFACIWTLSVLVQMLFLTVYAHVRTEPQCDIGQTRGKKKETHASLFPTCRRHQRSHFQLGHLAHLASEDTKPLPPQFQHLSQRPWCPRSSSDEGSSTVSPAPSGPLRLLARGCSWSSWACSRWARSRWASK